MARHGQMTGGTGVHDVPPLLARTSDDPVRRVKGVAVAVTHALGEIERKPLMIALALRGDKRASADPTAEVLDYTYAAARLTYPDGAWKEAVDAASRMATRRAKTFGIEDTARLAVLQAAGSELAMAFLLHDRLPVGAYLSLVSPWLAAFPHAAEVDGVGTALFTEEEITMTQDKDAATKTTSTRAPRAAKVVVEPVAKSAAKPAASKLRASGHADRRFWIQAKASSGEFYCAYLEAESGKVRRPGDNYATRKEAEADAKRRGWTVFPSREAATGETGAPKPKPTRAKAEQTGAGSETRSATPQLVKAVADAASKPRTRKPAAGKVTAEREAELMAEALDKTVTEQTEVKAVGGGAPTLASPLGQARKGAELHSPVQPPAHSSGAARRGCGCDYCEGRRAKAARAEKRVAKKAVAAVTS